MNLYKILKIITETAGPSGFEYRVSDQVRQLWEPLVDEIAVDRLGSLRAIKKGDGKEPRRSVLLAAHMDEIGLMVTNIEPNPANGYGFIRVTNVGGVDHRQILGQKVTIHGSKGEKNDLPGVIGILPDRMLADDDSNRTSELANFIVDPGLSYDEIVERISIGDFVSFRRSLRRLLNKRVTGKALDNRVSLAAVTKCLGLLRHRSHRWDVIAVATAQEETAMLGAYTSAFQFGPDLAIAVDVTFAKGPGITEDSTFNLGGGPAIGIGPNVHPGVYKALKNTANRIEMDVHVEPHSRMSGTDAIGLQMARQGIPTGLVSIPIRYMHTATEAVSLSDIKRASRLITELIADLDDAFLSELEDELMPAR